MQAPHCPQMALIPKGGMVGLGEVLILGYGFAEIGPLRSIYISLDLFVSSISEAVTLSRLLYFSCIVRNAREQT